MVYATTRFGEGLCQYWFGLCVRVLFCLWYFTIIYDMYARVCISTYTQVCVHVCRAICVVCVGVVCVYVREGRAHERLRIVCRPRPRKPALPPPPGGPPVSRPASPLPPVDPDAFHDILHEHNWTSAVGCVGGCVCSCREGCVCAPSRNHLGSLFPYVCVPYVRILWLLLLLLFSFRCCVYNVCLCRYGYLPSTQTGEGEEERGVSIGAAAVLRALSRLPQEVDGIRRCAVCVSVCIYVSTCVCVSVCVFIYVYVCVCKSLLGVLRRPSLLPCA